MPRFLLRSSVQLGRDGGQAIVRDPTLGRAIRLGESDAKLVQALGKGGTPSQLAKTSGLSEAEVWSRLRGLARLYLLQGKRSQARIALQSEREAFQKQCQEPTATEAIEWPLGRDPPQHGCVGTGTCCGASFLGPLTPRDKVRVGGLSFGSKQRFQAGDPVFETVVFGGREHVGMARDPQTERCLAQGDDLLCDVHREHGMEAKPVACRQFPLRFYRTPKGVHVSLLLACDGYDRARDAAEPWPDREQEVRKLLGQEAVAVRAALPFELAPGLPVPAAAWWQLRDELFALEPEGDADPHTWLAAVLQRADEAIAAREAELAEAPELTGDRPLARLTAALRAPATLYDTAKLADRRVQLQTRAADLRQRGHRHDAERLDDLERALAAQQTGRALQPRGTFQASRPALRHLHDVVANDLQVQVALGHLDAGLQNLVRRLLLAEALACDLAQRAGRTTVEAADTTRALHVVYRSEPDLAALAGCQPTPTP